MTYPNDPYSRAADEYGNPNYVPNGVPQGTPQGVTPGLGAPQTSIQRDPNTDTFAQVPGQPQAMGAPVAAMSVSGVPASGVPVGGVPAGGIPAGSYNAYGQAPMMAAPGHVAVAPPPQKSNNTPLIVIATIALLALLGGGGYFLWQNQAQNATPQQAVTVVTTTVQVAPQEGTNNQPAQPRPTARAGQPQPAYPAMAPVASCGTVAGKPVYTGTSVTSCPFAIRVAKQARGVFHSSGTIWAYSPVTDITYEMFCSDVGNDYMSCVGGDNAEVLIDY